MKQKELQPFGVYSAQAGSGVSRRDLIKVGALSFLGLALPEFAAEASARGRANTPPKEIAVILLWMQGGPSHIDTFDPKPEADVSIRGPFGAIKTNVSGIRISEHLPRLAREMDRAAILRGVTHGEGAHERAQHYLLTGYPLLPTLEFPSYGAMIGAAKGARNGLPPYVALLGVSEGMSAGFLGSSYDPFCAGNPDAAEVCRQAFDLRRESETLREEYGRSDFGQACLLARRLVERGTRFVTVTMDGWDTHDNHFARLKTNLLPDLDRGFSTLLRDLESRGLLESTLVVWMGEFGRTPLINANARPGRDHWPNAMSVVLAGGGIRGGQVIGRTDARGMEPLERPIRVENLAATLYHAVGLDSRQTYQTPSGCPVTLANNGSVLRELF